MSAIKIEIKSTQYGYAIPRTEVYVDEKFAYQSQNHPSVEREHIKKILELMVIENVKVEEK